MAKIRTKYVLRITKAELQEKWGSLPVPFCFKDPMFIQCTKDGSVNWEKNNVYQSDELKENFKVINP